MFVCKNCNKKMLRKVNFCPKCGWSCDEVLEKEEILNQDVGLDRKEKSSDREKKNLSEETNVGQEAKNLSEEVNLDQEVKNLSEEVNVGQEVKDLSEEVNLDQEVKNLSEETKSDQEDAEENQEKQEKLKSFFSKKKIAILFSVLIFVSAIIYSGYKKHLEELERIEIARQEEREEELRNENIDNYILDCYSMSNQLGVIKVLGGMYSDSMMEKWKEHAYGGLDEAIRKFQEENKTTISSLKDYQSKSKELFYNKIDTMPNNISTYTEIENLYNSASNAYEKSNSFLEITFSPLGTYQTYGKERIDKYKELKLAKDDLDDRTKILMEKRNLTEEDAKNREKLLKESL